MGWCTWAVAINPLRTESRSSSAPVQAEYRRSATADTAASASISGFRFIYLRFCIGTSGVKSNGEPQLWPALLGHLPHSACADGLQSAPDKLLSRPHSVVTVPPAPNLSLWAPREAWPQESRSKEPEVIFHEDCCCKIRKTGPHLLSFLPQPPQPPAGTAAATAPAHFCSKRPEWGPTSAHRSRRRRPRTVRGHAVGPPPVHTQHRTRALR